MIKFIDSEIQKYAEYYSSSEEDVLTELSSITSDKPIFKGMLSGNLQGQLLTLITSLLKPKLVLEIGTFTGYSAICIARGLEDSESSIITIEYNAELESTIQEYFKKSNTFNRIDLRIGDALEIIPELTESFDLIFIDADKKNYLNYYKMILPKLNTGGVIVVDNVLWEGKVIDYSCVDSTTIAIREFNEFVKSDMRVTKVMLPIRDGLYLIRKK